MLLNSCSWEEALCPWHGARYTWDEPKSEVRPELANF